MLSSKILPCIHLIILHCIIFPLFPQQLSPITYQNEGLTVDLGVGLWAWPLPMDFDQDGDLDLVVSCPDVPYKGLYFFENVEGNVEMPVFKPGKRLADTQRYLQVSTVAGEPRVLGPGIAYRNFRESVLKEGEEIPIDFDVKALFGRTRANEWKYVDYEGDGDQDILIGLGVWQDYGWDDAYDSLGVWENGPLHGYVFLAENTGTNEAPVYETPQKIEAQGVPIDVYGMPSPNFADFDNDGDLDLICGEFLDGFTYFQNVGSRKMPQYAKGKRLMYQGQPLHMDLQMITPTAIDWNKDGQIDLIVGDEDGRVALIKHTGILVDGIPQFLPPQYFQQEARDVKFGALVTPFSYDWDADGDEDLICGNTAGYIGFIENLDGGAPPRWAAPRYLKADGQVIRPMAGPNGSIQGPCEAKWGYSTLSVADWDHDGLPDILLNSIWGKVVWYENVGTIGNPVLTAARPITVEWEQNPPQPAWNWWAPQGKELASQWRTTPYAIDWNKDGLCDLVMLDHEGYLALYERVQENGHLHLKPPARIFLGANESQYDSKNRPQNGTPGEALQLNHNDGGGSGRRKFCITDWDQDGRMDILLNSVNVNFFRNLGTQPDGKVILENKGPISNHILAGHTTSPTVVDWDKNGIPDLLMGAEDGRLYYVPNPH